MDKAKAYEEAIDKLKERTSNESDLIANLANTSAILAEHMEDINWVGFYLFKEGQLVLGPFQGRPACVRIEVGKGVCGGAFLKNESVIIKDVMKFPGHIACDPRSKSEIVIPMHFMDKRVGVLDVDSPVVGRFDEVDQKYLQKIAKILEASCKWK